MKRLIFLSAAGVAALALILIIMFPLLPSLVVDLADECRLRFPRRRKGSTCAARELMRQGGDGRVQLEGRLVQAEDARLYPARVFKGPEVPGPVSPARRLRPTKPVG